MKKILVVFICAFSMHSMAAVEQVTCSFDDINPEVKNQTIKVTIDSGFQEVTLKNPIDNSEVVVAVRIRYNDPKNEDIYIEEGTEGKYKVTLDASKADSLNPSVIYTATVTNEGTDFPFTTYLILTRNVDDEKIAVRVSCK